jgi:prevent-host-death family protein
MQTVGVSEAQARLSELIDAAAAGDQVIITRDGAPVAQIIPTGRPTSLRDLKPSSLGAVLRPLSPDDDALDEMLGS